MTTESYTYADGYTAVSSIDGGEFRVPLHEYTRIVSEWTRGESFITIRCVNGSETVVKGSRIEAVTEWTAQALARFHDLVAEEKRAKMLRGDDS